MLGLLLVVAGCSGSAARIERHEEQDPLVRRARALRQAGDVDGALALYHKALERRPGLGRAHLEAGLLYDEEKQDYVRAIYHYETYLALRPDADKAEMVRELIRTARIHYAASLPDRPSEAIQQIAELKRENEKLRHQLREAQAAAEALRKAEKERPPEVVPAPPPVLAARAPETPAAAAPRPASAPTASAPLLLPPPAAPAGLETPPPAPASPAVETYRVQRGDSLSSIAAKMYDDSSQWRKIFEANRATLKNPESLRVGQVLIIPR